MSLDPFDDRVNCATCSHLKIDSGACNGFGRSYTPTTDIPRRCDRFKPRRGDPDQRSGKERWPEPAKKGSDA